MSLPVNKRSLVEELEFEYQCWIMEYPETHWAKLLHRSARRIRRLENALKIISQAPESVITSPGHGGVYIGAGYKDQAFVALNEEYDNV